MRSGVKTSKPATGAVSGFLVKRDRLLLFAVTSDCKKLKAVN